MPSSRRPATPPIGVATPTGTSVQPAGATAPPALIVPDPSAESTGPERPATSAGAAPQPVGSDPARPDPQSARGRITSSTAGASRSRYASPAGLRVSATRTYRRPGPATTAESCAQSS